MTKETEKQSLTTQLTEQSKPKISMYHSNESITDPILKSKDAWDRALIGITTVLGIGLIFSVIYGIATTVLNH